MSAISNTDWTVICDSDEPAPGCPSQLAGADLMANPNATELRRILRKRGWAVSVDDGSGRRRDYCPCCKPNREASK